MVPSSPPPHHELSSQSLKLFSGNKTPQYSMPGVTTTAASRPKAATSFFSDGFFYSGVAALIFLAVWAVWSFATPFPDSAPSFASSYSFSDNGKSIVPFTNSFTPSSTVPDLTEEPPDKTFYDDPSLTYTIDSPPIKNWDTKRSDWLKKHPSFLPGAENRVLMVTGSQATPCKNPIGDYLLLKLFKNKVDYCRRHGFDIFYNNVLLQPQMFSFWAKTPIVKAAMLAHPEAEWIWWVDSDAAITDMDFELPFHRYKDHNMVLHGWENLIYDEQSWTSLNAGVFLIRNCQWSMDFMDVWSSMGPQSPDYDKWGETQSSLFKDKIFRESDDQSGLVYLLLKERHKWGNKIYVESEYYFEGYWVEIVGNLENVTERYAEIERREAVLRRRRAEKVSEAYGRLWMEKLRLEGVGYGRGSWRRPFITHFTGCQPCSGDHNQIYSGRTCFEAMQRALNFADNQVLRSYGFYHPDIGDPTLVRPVPFGYPA